MVKNKKENKRWVGGEQRGGSERRGGEYYQNASKKILKELIKITLKIFVLKITLTDAKICSEKFKHTSVNSRME